MGSLELPADKPSSNMYFLLLLLGLATSSPVPQLTRVTRQTNNLLLLQAREGQTLAQSRQDFEDIDVPAGEAVDIFYRYLLWTDSITTEPRRTCWWRRRFRILMKSMRTTSLPGLSKRTEESRPRVEMIVWQNSWTSEWS